LKVNGFHGIWLSAGARPVAAMSSSIWAML
jgi:hypothetical protein